MKVGDMVVRKTKSVATGKAFTNSLQTKMGHGIILTKQFAGSNPVHPCITVYYPMTGEIWDIAESLVEVIGGSR